MCFETACWDILNGPARSLTEAGPRESLSSRERRVGAVSAEKVTVSESTTIRLWINPRSQHAISCWREGLRLVRAAGETSPRPDPTKKPRQHDSRRGPRC